MITKLVLAGDIGGTKTLLQLAEFEAGALRPRRIVRAHRFDSAAYDGLASMVREFLGDDCSPRLQACFGVAGPVAGGLQRQTAQLTNLPWQLDSVALTAELGVGTVRLVNDFAAVGYGIEALVPDDVQVLQERSPRGDTPRVVLGAGTGLGVALLLPCNDGYSIVPTEGGHTDFAPADPLQEGLLAFLRAELGHVSWERLVSGPGLVSIYRYLLSRDGADPAGDPLLQAPDRAAAIAGSETPRARAALDLFVSLYGAFAGNVALMTLAYGGVYLAGGIAPKLLPHLQQGTFARTFADKGRMRPVLEAMPVYVVTNPQAGLLGALLAASRLQ